MNVCSEPHLSQVRTYDRRSPLVVSKQSINASLKAIQRGDCVIAFSRKEIYRLRTAIQDATKLKCCVVYGALPPETRSGQAQLFNEPDSGTWMPRKIATGLLRQRGSAAVP